MERLNQMLLLLVETVVLPQYGRLSVAMVTCVLGLLFHLLLFFSLFDAVFFILQARNPYFGDWVELSSDNSAAKYFETC